MALYLAPIINSQQEDANGDPLTGGTIEVYFAGTSTAANTYSDQAGANPNTWPIVLNTIGVNNQGAVWLTGGFAYKFVIKNAAGVTQRTIDNVSGVNDTTISMDQWVLFQAAPTYVSATSFTVVGDQTQVFQPRRRVKTTNTGGAVYSTVISAAYSAPNTTVTVRNDSGVLDSGLSQVFYGLISAQNSSVTGLLLNVQRFTSNGTYTAALGTTFVIIEAVGGGGGGGGATVTGAGAASNGGGGGSGSYIMARINSGFSGAFVAVGVGGTGVVGANGNSGGTTTFGGTIVVAPAGAGGVTTGSFAPPLFGAAGNGGGAPTTTGTLLKSSSGTCGAPGLSLTIAGGNGGVGGSSLFGGGGFPAYQATGGAGYPATGSGGGGVMNPQSVGTAYAGGAGAAGLVLIWEFS